MRKTPQKTSFPRNQRLKPTKGGLDGGQQPRKASRLESKRHASGVQIRNPKCECKLATHGTRLALMFALNLAVWLPSSSGGHVDPSGSWLQHMAKFSWILHVSKTDIEYEEGKLDGFDSRFPFSSKSGQGDRRPPYHLE